MTIKEFYESVGGRYDEAMERLMKEERIAKYLGKFKNDPSCAEMADAFEKQDWETLFRASHTMKGVCYNLSLTALGDAASAVCESVRPGVAPKEDITALVDKTKELYVKNIEGIEACLGQA